MSAEKSITIQGSDGDRQVRDCEAVALESLMIKHMVEDGRLLRQCDSFAEGDQ